MKLLELELMFWRGFFIGFVLLLCSSLVLFFFKEPIYSLHAHFFPHLSPSILESNIYLLYGFMKILIFTFMFIPALSLYLQRSSKKKDPKT